MSDARTVKVRSVCVFCGSAAGTDARHAALARELGRACAAAAVRLVYGGARVGLMGAAAKAALDAGGSVYGIIPECLTQKEVVFDEADIEIVPDLASRKARMVAESDGFIVLPGGIGTLDEAVEVLSWRRLGQCDKPIVFLDDDDFWDPLADLLDHMICAGFATPDLSADVQRARTADAALWLLGVRPPVAAPA